MSVSDGDYGEFIDPNDDDDFEYLVEESSKYNPKKTDHVYYPICLGEVLNQQYCVEHKLDHGGFSTVWMAHDLKNKKDVALKIMTEGADLNERNCMWGIASLANLPKDAKYQALGRPHKVALTQLWKPGEIVKPFMVPETLRTDNFYLGDFGLAMKLGSPVVESGRPPIGYCSPDQYFTKHPTTACDIWSYMSICSRLYCGQTPFQTRPGVQVVTGMVGRLGPLPKQFKGCYCWPEDEEENWYTDFPNPEWDLAGVISRFSPSASPKELEHVLSFMYKCFDYLPEKRPSATQLLNDPSFQAIMDIHCL
ncbi:hypothetical protein PRK78_002920 [Emydomyces testavorans]|uniref:Protein kinase domain-containing protein n=1 Tax=Emydomyces testavorans TaxID=2070801 RepID=A0AAF0DFV5_9EURO|nr:hypothetical protein PRK78_002920 [Emydomyces testavorans]